MTYIHLQCFPQWFVTETRIRWEIHLLHTALTTQNMACIPIQCRAMINALLSGVQQSTFFLSFFRKQQAWTSQKRHTLIASWWTFETNAVCISQAHIPSVLLEWNKGFRRFGDIEPPLSLYVWVVQFLKDVSATAGCIHSCLMTVLTVQ